MSAPLLDGLLRASVEGALLVALVALVVRAVPALPAAARCALWWAACLKLLVAFAWWSPLELPVLPAVDAAAAEAAVAAPAALDAPAFRLEPRPAGTSPAASPAPAATAVSTAAPAPFTERATAAAVAYGPLALAFAWLLGVALGLAGLGRELVRLRRRVRRAEAVREPRLVARLEAVSRRLGVRAPRLLASHEVASPQVIGLVRPVLLLPADAVGGGGVDSGLDGTGSALDLVLGHELAHLRRRDLLLGWVPALAGRLFFFHPLAAYAAREYALAREAACDAEVLDALDTPPHDYGRMLLTWGVAGRPGGEHRGLLAAALGDRRQLKRRLLMLEQTAEHRRRLRPWAAILVALAVVACLTSVRLTAAPGGDHEPVLAPAAPTAPTVALPATTPAAPSAPVLVADAGHRDAPDAPDTPDRSDRKTTWNWHSDHDDDGMVLIDGDERKVYHGSSGDADRAERLRRGNESLVWFERDGREYVVRDPAVLRQIRQSMQPVEELGEKMGEIGKEMGKLGGHQGKWGAEHGVIGAEMGKLGAEMGKLGAELGVLVSQRVAAELSDADDSEIERFEAREEEIEEKMEALEEEMESFEIDMSGFEAEMDAFGEEMDAWGEKMDALGEEMEEEIETAMEDVDRTLDRAVADGTAEEVR